MDNALNYSTQLKTKYGDNFLKDYLRRRGAPLTIRDFNQLNGILNELLALLQSKNDNSINTIISYVDNLCYGRNNPEALTLLENLGLINGFAPQSAFQTTPFSQIDSNLRSNRENSATTEDLLLLNELPPEADGAQCPICLENLNGTVYKPYNM